MKENSTVVFAFLEAFPSDRISKEKKNFIVQFSIDSSNSCKLYRPIPWTF